ncbi:hypothetical protein [Neobacillus niacini]|uniref:hypothetical protein n=1 Tax=Neobacillus niacini TaxID=86668 RepID=UPI0021CB7393|nr:hypothetical protein [Neobacillus niacini]MCM3764531.1 hypothetical protein [Neobacillus niacini]
MGSLLRALATETRRLKHIGSPIELIGDRNQTVKADWVANQAYSYPNRMNIIDYYFLTS